ncbi:HNH endonuclease [Rossellomorea sp. FS2]|uniref:HNH endonuclease n=1 Tax=Rossellomorea sp. FS2 TaxID=3391447 RepID=UPI003A4DC878
MYNEELSASEREIGRNYSDYYDWRNAVYKRDKFTCVCCKKQGGVLNAHHILNYSSFPELRTDLDNGITLCKTCHQSFHSKYGRRNNNKDQLNEFIRKSS